MNTRKIAAVSASAPAPAAQKVAGAWVGGRPARPAAEPIACLLCNFISG